MVHNRLFLRVWEGPCLASSALGHKVIATSRNPSKTPEAVSEVKALGGEWLQLDVCSPNLEGEIKKALGIYGYIDIVVNNAGFSLLGAVETISDEEARSQMDTNFFAPLKIIRCLLPSMRERRSGTIVNISSTSGILAYPACGLYAASKNALEGFILLLCLLFSLILKFLLYAGVSESLSHELKPFGIRTIIIQPGAFNTSFVSNYISPTQSLPEDYKGTPVDAVLSGMSSMIGAMGGDPEKACQAIFDVVTKTGLAEKIDGEYLRIPLGTDSANGVQGKINTLQKTVDETRVFWESTDICKNVIGKNLDFDPYKAT